MSQIRSQNLLAVFSEVAKLVGSLKATLLQYNGGRTMPLELELWTVSIAGYAHVMIHLAVCLASHSEWAEELDLLMEPSGCAANKIPIILEFLQKKGAPPDEAFALVVN